MIQSFFFKVLILTILLIPLIAFLQNTKKQQNAYTDHEKTKEMLLIQKRKKNINNKNTKTPHYDIKRMIQDMAISIIYKNDSITNQEHNIAGQKEIEMSKQYHAICSQYKTLCKKTIREGSYSIKEQLYSQVLIIYLLEKKDKILQNNRKLSQKSLEHVLSYIKITKNKAKKRGSAGQKHIKIDIGMSKNYRELWQVLTHEVAHIIDLSLLQGTSNIKTPQFTEFGEIKRSIDDPSIDFYTISRIDEYTRKAESSYKDFVSGYAMKGIYEDFAESIQLRFNHNDYFQKLASSNEKLRQKYNYIASLYQDNYFSSSLLTQYPDIGERKRDTTRLQ